MASLGLRLNLDHALKSANRLDPRLTSNPDTFSGIVWSVVIAVEYVLRLRCRDARTDHGLIALIKVCRDYSL